MKHFLLMAAFVAGSTLYAQQSPSTANNLSDIKPAKTEQRSAPEAAKSAETQTTESKSADETPAGIKRVNAKSIELERTAVKRKGVERKGANATSLKEAVEN